MSDGTEHDRGGPYDAGEQRIAVELFEQHYDTLKSVARERRRRMGASDSLRTVELLHEAFLKMEGRDKSYQDAQHFLRSAALAMRHVIVDHARRKLAQRRGSGVAPVEYEEETMGEFGETPEQIVAISDLLDTLGAENPRWLRIVDARYFAGLTEVETADMLGVSDRTVRRDWVAARAWLAERLDVAA